jgi:hypothetical protein
VSITATIILTASLFNIPRAELAAVLQVESATCKFKVNKASSARGCGQILQNTAKHYGFNWKLMNDNEYSIIATGFILAQLRQRTPDYICAYNQGLAGAKKFKHTTCKHYNKLVNSAKIYNQRRLYATK